MTSLPNSHKRPSWDEYFMSLAEIVSSRGTCDRGYAGTVIVRDKRVLTTGYVGSAPGQPHCDEVGHDMRTLSDESGNKSQHCVRTIHSEQNAIVQGARNGISLLGATVYTKFEPCLVCARMIVNAGIVRVVAKRKYHAATDTRSLLTSAGVKLDVLENTTEAYANQ